MPKKPSKPKSSKPAKPAKSRAKPAAKAAPKEPADAQPRRMSGLSAAAEVLRLASGTPMRVGDLTAKARELGLWTPGGKTPAATLNAALIKEIATKGGASRFRKHSRGLFELNG
jgi:hypothetical protein